MRVPLSDASTFVEVQDDCTSWYISAAIGTLDESTHCSPNASIFLSSKLCFGAFSVISLHFFFPFCYEFPLLAHCVVGPSVSGPGLSSV